MQKMTTLDFWKDFCPYLRGEYADVARKIVSYALLSRADRDEYLNILLVGDSSCGKSEILRSATKLFSFCHFVSTDTSRAGLGFDARWGGKEGLAIKAMGGFLMIDEFDKQENQLYKILLEIMDKHTLTITKGGHRKILNAKVNVIGACNQRNFKWDEISIEEVPLPFVLLTRFHLIIPLGSLDKKYYPEVAENYSDEKRETFRTMEERFRGFIEYCRDINVTITKSMSRYAGIFFQHMKKSGLDEYFPITPRQIEGFINLSKCVARANHKSIVDKSILMQTAELYSDVLKNYIKLGEEIGIIPTKLKKFLKS